MHRRLLYLLLPIVLTLATTATLFAADQPLLAIDPIDPAASQQNAAVTSRVAGQYHVDADATGTATGLSWTDAFTNVQDALAVATSGDTIWVAEGTYYPDVGGGMTDGDESASFDIPPGVQVYGGFDPDSGADAFGERDWNLYLTILSGDVDNNDDASPAATPDDIVGQNSDHVVYIDGTTVPVTETTVLDGFTITAGQAEGALFDPAKDGGGFYCDGQAAGSVCSPTIANTTFSGNTGTHGGAMFNIGNNNGRSSPLLMNVTFSGNSAANGGAIYNRSFFGDSSPQLVDVTFSDNSATASGGAMFNDGNTGNSSPLLVNVAFRGNSASSFGGALFNEGFFGNSSPEFYNVTFSGNSAVDGGAMYNSGLVGVSSPQLINVSFAGNSAATGGAMTNNGGSGASSPQLVNVILWGNEAPNGSEIYNIDATPTISYSIVQSGTAGIVDAGSSTTSYDAGTNKEADPQFVQPVDAADAPTAAGDLRLQIGSPAIDMGDNSAVPVTVTTDLAGNPRIVNGIVDIGAYEAPPTPLYVDEDATGLATGLSWTDAFTNLQDALVYAVPGVEIWVAEGTYYPDVGGGMTDGDESASFNISSNISIYGGFDPGSGADVFAERDWDAYPTILSGDVDNNDDASPAATPGDIVGQNSDNVVIVDGTSVPVTETTTIDGFIITAGQANGGPAAAIRGAGLYCNGGGVGATCSPLLVNLIFTGNRASQTGGALYNYGVDDGDSSPMLRSVVFSGNSAFASGGAIFNDGLNGRSNPTIVNSAFRGNLATNGGAIVSYSFQGESSPTLVNVSFNGNRATSEGGALHNFGFGGSSLPAITNVILWGNTAPIGAEIYSSSATPTISNSIVQGGIAGPGIVEGGSGTVIDGGGNKDADPLFVQPVDPADAPTSAGDLRLQIGSPAIDMGVNSVVSTLTDLAGNPRIVNSTVDIGAYEAPPTPLYVDEDATGLATGLSWTDAFTNLQDALVYAVPGVEIWVAEGTYYPDVGGGMTAGDETASFNIHSGVAIYGGFDPGSGADDFAERDWDAYPTILSGDIDDNDNARSARAPSSSHIVGANSNNIVFIDGTTVPVTETTVIDGFTITAGQADGANPGNEGGGLHCNAKDTGSVCSPTIANTTFSGNTAVYGGAIFCDAALGSCSPRLINSTFSNNWANNGGAFATVDLGAPSSPQFINTRFRGNSGGIGGAIRFDSYVNGSALLLVNVEFSGNSSTRGGAIYVFALSPDLINVTFNGNSSSGIGGAIFSSGATMQLDNVTLWGNSAASGNEIYLFESSLAISHSIVQGGVGGPGIFIDGGTVNDGGDNKDADPLFVQPVNPADAPTTAGDLRLQIGSPAIDMGDNSVVTAMTDLAGNPRIINSVVDIGAYEFANTQSPIYVDEDATGLATGLSWTDAFTNLQDALVYAVPGVDIWVAEGTYYPDVGGNMSDGDESASFNISSNISIYGGFDPGSGADDFAERDWDAHETILSGDVDNNDTARSARAPNSSHIVGDNSDHVVFIDGTTVPVTETTVLDGFTITAGQADGSLPANRGGGLYCNGAGNGSACSPTIANVTFSGNSAVFAGGAMVNDGNSGSSSPQLVNVTFSGNSAGEDGGAMFNDGDSGTSSPQLVDVTFSGNSAGHEGGAMNNHGDFFGTSSPQLVNVTFSGNSAGFDGGAMYNFGEFSGISSPQLVNVTFSGNSADRGGAMFNFGLSGTSSPQLVNVTFSGNSAVSQGGAMYNIGLSGTSSPQLVNVILWGNEASLGSQIYNNNSTPAISYSIVQSGTAGIVDAGSSTTSYDAGTNKDADPLFVQPVDAANAPTTAGDLRLLPCSPAIDMGDNSAVPVTVTTDLDGNPRIVNAVVDIGAYEYPADGEPCGGDVAIVKTAAPAVSGPGETLSYTLVFSNVGETVVSGVTISDSLPAEVTLTGVISSGVPITQTGSSPLTFDVADLQPGQVGTITLSVKITTNLMVPAVFTNTAAITATNELTPSDNISRAAVTVPGDSFSIGDATEVEGDAGVTLFTFTISRTTDVYSNSVTVTSSDDSAVAPGDYGAVSQQVEFPTGTGLTRTVTVSVTGDTDVEPDETFTMTLSSPAYGTLSDAAGRGTIVDDDVEFSIAARDADKLEGDSGSNPFTFVVTRTRGADGPNSVDYRITPTDGFAGDFDGSGVVRSAPDHLHTGTILFTASEITKTLIVSVTGDTLVEPDETFTVTLENPARAVRSVEIVDGEAIGVIRNDDTATLTISDTTVIEWESGMTSAVFTLTLDAPVQNGFTVDYATSDGTAEDSSDYDANSGTVAFSGVPGEMRIITATVNGDTLVEPDETFSMTLSNVSMAGVIPSNSPATATIINDDFAVLDISDSTVDEGAGSATFTVTQSNESVFTTTVKYETQPGTATENVDYLAVSGTLTLTAGVTQTTLTVPIVDDALDENQETYSVTLSMPISATIGNGVGEGRISDNDPAPRISIQATETVTEENGTVTLLVQLSSPSGLDVGFDFQTKPKTATTPQDFVRTTGRMTITAGMTQTTITVPIVDDNIAEADEQFAVAIDNVENATFVRRSSLPQLTFLTGNAQAIVTIDDSHDRGNVAIIVSPTSMQLFEGSSMTFNVRLATEPQAPVRFAVVSKNPSACTVSPRLFRIMPADWNTGQTITVQAISDGAADGDRKCPVDVKPVRSRDDFYHGINPPNVDVTVLDGDVPNVPTAIATGATSTQTVTGMQSIAAILLLTVLTLRRLQRRDE